MPDDRNRPDPDPEETEEWLDALESVIERDGPERAHFLIESLVDKARRRGAYLPYNATTAYLNTIPPHHEAQRPGDPALERRLKSLVRWNALAMVVRANRADTAWGAISPPISRRRISTRSASITSSARRSDEHGGDLVYMQGHSSPGVYARAFLEGRISDEEMVHFRREVDGRGLSSYPHPWLMPDFWQFATVSMGLDSIMAIYQARFLKYLDNRGILDAGDRKVWAFLGDGEMDEPESLGAISLATREQPRQPDLRHQLQPAAPRRAGARQRQDHPGARVGLPWRRLERHQGRLGRQLGPAPGHRERRSAAPAHGRGGRR